MIIPLTITIPSPGLDLGYTVLDLDRAVYAPFTAAGMVEVGNGVYAVSGGVEVPAAGGYVQVWTDDGGEPAEFVGEAAVEGDGGQALLEALEATAQAILEDTGTTLPGLIAGIEGGGGAGAGAVTFTYTLTSTVDSAPIADADVWVTSDEAGSVVLASGRTDQNGVVTFYLDAGTVYVWRQKSGWNFENPDTEVVA